MAFMRTRGGSASEVKIACDLLGLQLCDRCSKTNEDRIKTIASNMEYLAKMSEQASELQVMKKMLEDLNIRNKDFDDFRENIAKEVKDIKDLIESAAEKEKQILEQRNELEKLKQRMGETAESSQKKWSELFTKKVDMLTNEVRTVKSTVKDAKDKIETGDERLKRRNNIVFYNLEEGPNDKASIIKLINEVTCQDLAGSIQDSFRMGKKSEEGKARPLLLKLDCYGTKNTIMENSYKLRKSENFSRVMMNHDMSVEERQEIRKLIEQKKKEIEEKENPTLWGIRIRGEPGKFIANIYRKQGL